MTIFFFSDQHSLVISSKLNGKNLRMIANVSISTSELVMLKSWNIFWGVSLSLYF